VPWFPSDWSPFLQSILNRWFQRFRVYLSHDCGRSIELPTILGGFGFSFLGPKSKEWELILKDTDPTILSGIIALANSYFRRFESQANWDFCSDLLMILSRVQSSTSSRGIDLPSHNEYWEAINDSFTHLNNYGRSINQPIVFTLDNNPFKNSDDLKIIRLTSLREFLQNNGYISDVFLISLLRKNEVLAQLLKQVPGDDFRERSFKARMRVLKDSLSKLGIEVTLNPNINVILDFFQKIVSFDKLFISLQKERWVLKETLLDPENSLGICADHGLKSMFKSLPSFDVRITPQILGSQI